MSNRELAEEIGLLAELLGVEANTEGLKNSELVSLLEGLKAKVEGGAPPVLPPAPPPAPDPVPVSAEPTGFVVAPGKALVCRRGSLTAGAVITADDLSEKPEEGAKLLKDLCGPGESGKGPYVVPASA